MTRLTFLSHFILCLAVAAAAWFAWRSGLFGAVWAGDASHMTSVIGVLFIGTSGWLGWQSWKVGGDYFQRREADASFGHLAERMLPMIGLFGTAFGLSMQAKALSAGGGPAFMPLATSLYCTASGVLAALLVALMTHSLETGMRRAAR